MTLGMKRDETATSAGSWTPLDTAIQYNTIQYSTVQYTTIHCNIIHYNTLQYTTIHYSTLQYTAIHGTILRPSQKDWHILRLQLTMNLFVEVVLYIKCQKIVKKCQSVFPQIQQEVLRCLVWSTAQRYSGYCQRGLKHTKNIHIQGAGTRVLKMTHWIINCQEQSMIHWIVVKESINRWILGAAYGLIQRT